MLSSATKSDAFIPYKKSCFYKIKSREKSKVLYFSLKVIVKKCALQNFHPKYNKNCYVKVYPEFFSLEVLSQKSSSWFPSCPVKNIFHKSVTILTFHIYIWNYGAWFDF